jgi:hypothetical protein
MTRPAITFTGRDGTAVVIAQGALWRVELRGCKGMRVDWYKTAPDARMVAIALAHWGKAPVGIPSTLGFDFPRAVHS